MFSLYNHQFGFGYSETFNGVYAGRHWVAPLFGTEALWQTYVHRADFISLSLGVCREQNKRYRPLEGKVSTPEWWYDRVIGNQRQIKVACGSGNETIMHFRDIFNS